MAQRLGDLPRAARNALAAAFTTSPYTGPTAIPQQQPYPPPHNGTWLPKGILGTGGEGVAAWWVLVDRHQRIIDRVVVKKAFLGHGTFNDPDLWTGGNIGGEPREYRSAVDLFNELEHPTAVGLTPASHLIVECRGFGDIRGGQDCTYKLYFEFCGAGDLNSMVHAQLHARLGLRRTIGDRWVERDGSVATPFSEPWVWHLFYRLARVAKAMCDIEMIHGDLQPANILFGEPHPTEFPAFHTPKVSDLGSAVITNRRDPKNRDGYHVACLQECAPPELSFFIKRRKRRRDDPDYDEDDPDSEEAILGDEDDEDDDGDGDDSNTVSSDSGGGQWATNLPSYRKWRPQTNVYQVGMAVLIAMRRQFPVKEVRWRNGWQDPLHERLDYQRPFKCKDRLKVSDGLPKGAYSRRLIRLVQKCLEPIPLNRPHPDDLLDDIVSVFNQHPRLLDGMKDHLATGGRRRHLPNKDKIMDDPFQIGRIYNPGGADRRMVRELGWGLN